MEKIRPWQKQSQIWDNLLKRNNLPSTWLFTGPKGSNILEYSLLLSHFLLALPNHTVPNLIESTELTLSEFIQRNINLITLSPKHQDFYLLNPAVVKDLDNGLTSSITSKNKTRVISVDMIREARIFLQNTTVTAKTKILLLNGVENLSVGASNALLKVLEEPSKDSLIILLNHNLHQVMPTIKSRCAIMKFSPATQEEFYILSEVALHNSSQKIESSAIHKITAGDISLICRILAEPKVLELMKAYYEKVLALIEPILNCLGVLNEEDKLIKDLNLCLMQFIKDLRASKIVAEDIMKLILNLIVSVLNHFSLMDAKAHNPEYITFSLAKYKIYLIIEKIMKLIEQKKRYHLDENSLFHQIINIEL